MIKQRFFLILSVVAAVACSKNDELTPAVQPGDLVLSFDAGTSSAEADPADATRAGYDGAKSIWHAGDIVGVSFDATNKNLQFSQESGSLSSDGTFVKYSGTLVSPISGNVTCVAYYPHSSTATVSGQSITTTFPATQTYNAAGGYKGVPLFATYTGDSKAVKLGFKNLFSVIKLTLVKGSALTNTVKLQSIVFQGNNNETVAGAMAVNMSGSTPVVSYPGTGKTITLDCGSGVTLTTAPQTFYIAVPAINYTKGYSFTFITDNGQVTKSAKSAGVQYAVNKVYAAPALTIDNLTITTIIPDGNLRQALQGLGLISILDAVSGKVGITTAGLQATSINISGKNIADLTGLDKFPLLVDLKAGNNNLASVDLSKLTLLTNLDLSGNQLTNLNLAANTALLTLNVASNQLQSLNVSANTLLTSLNVSGNQLTGLNLAANLALLSLDVSSNALTNLDLHNNILLTSLKVYGNSLVTLNISGLKALLTLNLVNGVNSIDTVLKTLTIPATAVVQNLISDGVALTNWLNVICQNNPNIVSISVKNNTGLLSATITGNANLTSLDVSGNATMTGLTANTNAKLSALNMAGNLLLATLDVSSNLLTNLDLRTFVALTSVKVFGNALVTLNLSGLNLLNALYLNSTTDAIASLKLTIPTDANVQNFIFDGVSVASLWTSFECSNNPTVQSISLKNNVKLLSATVANNGNLVTLDLSGNILQTFLRAHGTGTSILTTLNISGMKALTTLYFSSLNNNCIALQGVPIPLIPTLTIPASTKIKNIIADGTLLAATWTHFVCSNNVVVQTISLKNNLGLLGVTLTNNNSLTSLVMTGSGLGLAGVTASGNAAGFAVTN